MTGTLSLLGYAVLLATAGTAVLRRAGWTRRAPRLAILCWYALSLSIIGSVLLAGVTAAVSATRDGGTARACHAPSHWPCAPPTTPAGVVLAIVIAAAALAVIARIAWCLATTCAAAGRRRGDQLDALAVLGRADDRLGVTVIDHAAPAAYCLPGRVVVTTAALAALDDRGVAAVIAHERAHLSQRHHLMRTTAQALVQAFPHVRAFAVAREEIGRLAELAADDAAAKRSGPLTVAAALLALAEAAPVPAPALTAGGTTAAARARRLIAGERPLGHTRVLLGLAAAALVLSAPVAAVAALAPAAPSAACCTTAPPAHGAP
jgi:Zn-dependent protease with chaperone function